MPKVSVTVITRDEARNLAAALESVAWADEIVVVDSASTDDTVAIARRFTDHVVVREWPGYVAQKNHAASIASHDWIFSLDADERVTPALAAEIRDVMSRETLETMPAAYQVPRVTWHLGRWIRSTDWYPDHQVRLYDRRRARWTGQYVHEALEVLPAGGPVGTLRGDLQHYPFRDIADHLDTINKYTTYSAKQMYESGRRAGVLQIIGHPPLAFLRNYIAKGGIRDGGPGLVISAMNAYYVYLKFAKLWELSRVQGSGFKVQGSVEPRTGSEEPGTKNPEP